MYLAMYKWTFVRIFLFCIGISLLAYIFYIGSDKFYLLKNKFYFFASMILIQYLISIFNVLTTKIILNYFGSSVSFIKGLRIIIMSSIANIIVPFGSLFSRGLLLKKESRLSYSNYTASMIAVNLWNLYIISIISTILISTINKDNDIVRIFQFLSVIFIIIILSITIIFFIPYKIAAKYLKSDMRIIRIFCQVLEGFDIIFSKKKYINTLLISAIIIIVCILSACMYWFAFGIVTNGNVTFRNIFIFSVLQGTLSLFVIIPGNFGFQEGYFVTLAVAFGIDFNTAASCAIFFRLASLSALLIHYIIISLLPNDISFHNKEHMIN
ncbi:MAG TPA: hypothetical protein ENH23_03635 [candidate division Zixibacteria bacterium]|nr:hypothetical protein [candidate division Zixibacteria bacterium]